MPTSCAVFGCKSGYKNHPYNGSIYLFPSDEDERQSWIDALPNRDFKWTKYKGVCCLHWPHFANFKKVTIKRHNIPGEPMP